MKVDICAEISERDLGEDFCRLQHEVKQLKAHITTLDKVNETLRNTIGEIKATQNNIAQNISELCNTAQNELQRQDSVIAQLRQQLDDTVFRRYNRRGKCDREQQVEPDESRAKRLECSGDTSDQQKLTTSDQPKTTGEILIHDHRQDGEQNRHGSNLPNINRLNTTEENAITSNHQHQNLPRGRQKSQFRSKSPEYSARNNGEKEQHGSSCYAREQLKNHSESSSDQTRNISKEKYCSYDRDSSDGPARPRPNSSRYNSGEQCASAPHRKNFETILNARRKKSPDTTTATENNQKTHPRSTPDMNNGSEKVKYKQNTAPFSDQNSTANNIEKTLDSSVNKEQVCGPTSDVDNDKHINMKKVAPFGKNRTSMNTIGEDEKVVTPVSGTTRTSTCSRDGQKVDSRPTSEVDKYKHTNVKEIGSKTNSNEVEVVEKAVMPLLKSVRTSTTSHGHREPNTCPTSDIHRNVAKGKVSGKSAQSKYSIQHKAAIYVREAKKTEKVSTSLFDDGAKNNESYRKKTTKKKEEPLQTSSPTVDKTASRNKGEVSRTGRPTAVKRPTKNKSKDHQIIGDERTETKKKPSSINITKENKSSRSDDKKGSSSDKSEAIPVTNGNSTEQTDMNEYIETNRLNETRQETQNGPGKPSSGKSCSMYEHQEGKDRTSVAPNTKRTKSLHNKIEEEKCSIGVKLRQTSNPVTHPPKANSTRILPETLEKAQQEPKLSTADKIEQGDQHMLKRYLYEGTIKLHVKDYKGVDCCESGWTPHQRHGGEPSSLSTGSQQEMVAATEANSISEASARDGLEIGLDPRERNSKSGLFKGPLDIHNTTEDSDISTPKSKLQWTRDEDKIILQTSKQHSEKQEIIQLISQLLPNRSVVEIKHRFEKLLILLQPTSSGQVS